MNSIVRNSIPIIAFCFDLSLNGTFVLFESGEEVVLRKDRTGLYGSGVIALGKQLPPDSEERILFRVTDG